MLSDAINTDNKDIIELLITEILKVNKLQSKFLSISVAALSSEKISLFTSYLQYCIDRDLSLEYLSNCYDLIVKDTLSNQLYFKRNKKYRYSSYAEVESLVYRNDDYMKMYMYGLAITAFLWLNHAQMMDFFKATLPKQTTGKYLEIGPGHGFYMMESMRISQYDDFLGIDISPTSVDLTKSILSSKYFGDFTKYQVEEYDFLSWNTDRKFDAVVMGEVLEHVEQPIEFLKKIAAVTHKKSHIYITTCINSPAIDHIYLFENSQQITELVELSGLQVKDRLLIPYQATSLEESEKDFLPINIALVLEKIND